MDEATGVSREIEDAIKLHPAPWAAKIEPSPLGETGDEELPVVIRDAAGVEVLTLWEDYGPGLTDLRAFHAMRASLIVAAVNAFDPSYGEQCRRAGAEAALKEIAKESKHEG